MLKIIKNTLLIIAIILCFSACGNEEAKDEQCEIKTSSITNGMNGESSKTYWKCDDYFESLQLFDSEIGAYTPYLDVENPRRSRLFKWERADCNQIRFMVYRDLDNFEGEGRITLIDLQEDRLELRAQYQGLDVHTECTRIEF